jgi:hypothetical protein
MGNIEAMYGMNGGVNWYDEIAKDSSSKNNLLIPARCNLQEHLLCFHSHPGQASRFQPFNRCRLQRDRVVGYSAIPRPKLGPQARAWDETRWRLAG